MKWILVIPHLVVLAFAWVAYVLLSIVAFFAILVTGVYPRPLFEFNVGVMRWSWRVAYYTWAGLGTDQYPPFTLDDVPDYPARLEIPYPERLSRGLVLVKWWLLTIPHYIIVGIFIGSPFWFGRWVGGGLVSICTFVAAITLAVTASYPRQLFDLILGMDRWVLRVAAYAGLMTDAYPPFRLDTGGTDPASPMAFEHAVADVPV
ncbi:MAG TPA: DUF4389 domain-containing protein [Micromonosporaceae bacterium]|nr:DUF4389 domain-containing protein [Micromonosporaceae bacterium]